MTNEKSLPGYFWKHKPTGKTGTNTFTPIHHWHFGFMEGVPEAMLERIKRNLIDRWNRESKGSAE